jgi:hypothetical protein
MHIQVINYQKTFNLGNYSSEKIGVEIALNQGDDAKLALQEAQKLVEEYHQENLEKIQFQSVEEIIWNEPVKKEKKETKSVTQRTKEFIDSSKTVKELKAWELMCKNNVELSQYYNEKFLTLK